MNKIQKNQKKESEWFEQWEMFEDNELFLFEDWIAPLTLDDFLGKQVLEFGCGGGQHTRFVAPYCKSITAIDLNTAEIAREHTKNLHNVQILEGDIATIDLGRQFDIVFCIGVIHHTDNPDVTFMNLFRHAKPGGKIVVWTYSAEGNEIMRFIVEPIRKALLRNVNRRTIYQISKLITLALYPIVHTIYSLSIFSFLPYYEYFENFRKLSFKRNLLNIFDKLNAPQTHFTTKNKCYEWFNPLRFKGGSISIKRYRGVSYSLLGEKLDSEQKYVK
tara:strand:+ start:232 stop:1053 length:822 start_codon:yes stop_codon:yes gene_type:complete